MSRPAPRTCKTRNWPDYNAALKRRGSLTNWFDPAVAWEAAPTGKRGRQLDYSDAAPDLSDDEGADWHGTQANDRFRRELAAADRPRLGVQNFSTLSRRQTALKVNIPYRGSQARCIA